MWLGPIEVRLAFGKADGHTPKELVLSNHLGSAVLSTFMTNLALFAQDAPKAANPVSPLIQWMPLVMIGVLFYFLLMRPQKKERQRQQAMLAAVKKNDRVVTTGGIFGVVTNVRTEENEVTIKVDEATNTKLRVTLNSIARVLSDETSND